MPLSRQPSKNQMAARELGFSLPSTPGTADLDFLLPRFHSTSKTPSPTSSPISSPVSRTASPTPPPGLQTPEDLDGFFTPSLPWTSPRCGGHARGYSSATSPSPSAQGKNLKKRRALDVPLSIAPPSPGSAWRTPEATPRSPRFSSIHPLAPRRPRRSKYVWAGAALVTLVLLLDATLAATSNQPSTSARLFSLVSSLSLPAFSSTTDYHSTIEEPQRDALVLYRIIGNDLPPRHALNQTLQNVHFLLENELSMSKTPELFPSSTAQNHALQRVDKYFVLNRITLPDTRIALRHLLLEYNIPEDRILEIPFEWEEYEQREFRWDGGVADAADVWGLQRYQADDDEARYNEAELRNRTLSAVAEEASPLNDPASQVSKKKRKSEIIGKLRAIDYTYHDKNLYAINNNGGRNFALEHGRSLPHARWILPLDGNCFFTPPAMASLLGTLQTVGEGQDAKRHIVIPMKRLLDNQIIMSTNSLDAISKEAQAPDTPEEPQAGFRFDSQETFQEHMRYGRRSKLEFLWRLGAVPRGRNLDQRTLPWESSDRSYLTSESYASIKNQQDQETTTGFASAGWVYRLFSGDRNQEVTSPSANSLRNMNRIKGIVGYLEGLDEQLSRGKMCSEDQSPCGFRQRNTVVWDHPQLQKFRAGVRADQPEALERLIQLAENAHTSGQDVQQTAQGVATSAVLAYLTDDLYLARQVAEAISKTFFAHPRQFLRESDAALERVTSDPSQAVDGEGYAFPVLPPSRQSGGRSPAWQLFAHPKAQLSSVQLPFAPADFDASLLLDGIRLIHELDPGLLPMSSIKTLFSIQLAHLLQPSFVKQTVQFNLDQAQAYDLQIASLAAFLDDVRLLNRIKHRAHLRSSDRTLNPALLTRLEHAGLMDTEPQDSQLVWQVMDHL